MMERDIFGIGVLQEDDLGKIFQLVLIFFYICLLSQLGHNFIPGYVSEDF